MGEKISIKKIVTPILKETLGEKCPEEEVLNEIISITTKTVLSKIKERAILLIKQENS